MAAIIPEVFVTFVPRQMKRNCKPTFVFIDVTLFVRDIVRIWRSAANVLKRNTAPNYVCTLCHTAFINFLFDYFYIYTPLLKLLHSAITTSRDYLSLVNCYSFELMLTFASETVCLS